MHYEKADPLTLSTVQNRYCLVFVCAVIGIRLLLISKVPLLGAESYYWEWSKYPAWGYFDHPPVIAFLIYCFTWIGGDSVFFVKLSALVPGMLTTVILYYLAKDMFGRSTAWIVCCIFQILPFFAVVSVCAIPDAPLAFFWLLTVYCVCRATIHNRPVFWYAAGVSFGLALLSKYHGFLLAPCIFIYLALSRDMNRWLKRKEPYTALCIGLLIFLPNIVWNARYGLTTFSYLFAERHGSINFSITGPVVFLGGFLALLSPLFAVLVVRLLPHMKRAALTDRDNRYLLLLATALVPIIFFGLLSPLIDVGAHWPAIGYTTLCLAALSMLMASRTPKGPSLQQTFPVVSIAFSLVLVLCAYLVPLLLMAEAVPAKMNFADRSYAVRIKELHGWKELGRHIDEHMAAMPEPDQTFIITHAYRLASQVRFLTGSQYITGITGHKSPHQYGIWDKTRRLKEWDALFVDKEDDHKDRKILEKLFSRVGPAEPVNITKDKEVIRTFYIIKCYGYTPAPQTEK